MKKRANKADKYEGEKLLLFHITKNLAFTFMQRLSYSLSFDTENGYMSYNKIKEEFDKWIDATTEAEEKYRDSLFENMMSEVEIEKVYTDKESPDYNAKKLTKKHVKRISFWENDEGSAEYTTAIKCDDGPATVPILLNIYEKRYLKTLLSQDVFKKVASNELVEALNKELYDVEPFDWDSLIVHRGRWEPHMDIGFGCADNLVKILSIIENRRKMQCIYNGGPMAGCKQLIIPYKIMISPFTSKIQLMALPDNEKRIILMNVDRFEMIEPADEHGYSDENFQEMLEKKKSSAPLVLEIRDKDKTNTRRNGIIRAFTMFSNHKTYSYCESNSEDAEYRMEVEYYDFDEDDIVQKMLQLGQVVTVISPSHIRRRVAESIRAAYRNYM